MTYNSTVDINKLNIYGHVKYTDDSTYNYKERNIIYMPHGTLSDIFVDNYNSMIVRNNNGYYEDHISKLNYNITNDEILDVYRNELKDYINIYNQYYKERDKINNHEQLQKYDEFVNEFVIYKIITLNDIIYDRLKFTNDIIIENNSSYNNILVTTIIGIILLFVIIMTCVHSHKYYK